jgi:superfamily II DNA or RNA helicase
MIDLRPYQNDIVFRIRKSLSQKNKKILTQLPTGGGKTVIFSYIALSAAQKDKKVLILTDRDELLKQAGGTMKKFGLNCAYIKAGSKFIDYRKNIYVAMSQTLRNRIKLKEWRDFILNDIDLIIIDEAHIQEFNYLFEDGILDTKTVLGFTATPSRSGKMRQLGIDYEKLIRGAEPKNLIDLGYLLNCDLYEFPTPDMKGVTMNSNTGDFNELSMFKRFDKPTLYQGILSNYEKHTPGQKMLVFCCNVEHAIKTAIQFQEAGYNARFVCSEKAEPKALKTKDLFGNDVKQGDVERYNESMKSYLFFKENYAKYSGTRKQIFDGFAENKFKILINVDIATKGYDCPDIEVVAIYRATNSMTMWLQMLGRGSRLSKGKEFFTVFDFGGNKQRLGGYDDNRDWSLWHETRKEGGGVPPLKECGITNTGKEITSSNDIKKGCKRLILASYQLCPFCGFKYPDKKEAKEVELVLADIKDDNGVSLSVKSFDKMSWDELSLYREIKKHKMPWLWRQLFIKGGEAELRSYASSKNWSRSVTDQALNYCKNIF